MLNFIYAQNLWIRRIEREGGIKDQARIIHPFPEKNSLGFRFVNYKFPDVKEIETKIVRILHIPEIEMGKLL